MPNHYDRIFKENIEAMIALLAEKILGLEIQKTLEIKDKAQITLERECDYLKIVIHNDSALNYILQIEIQSTNEQMNKRMLLYYGILHHKIGLPVKQFVIYIGDETLTMKNNIEHSSLNFNFTIVNLKDYDVNLFLNSSKPEEIILAILSNFGTNKPEEVVKQILERIEKIVGRGLKLNKYARQLQILSMLRNLQPITNQQIKDMALAINIRQDVYYKQGFEEATEKFVVFLLEGNDKTDEQIADIANINVAIVRKIKKEWLKNKQK